MARSSRRRLPKKFNRPVSEPMQKFAAKHYKRERVKRSDRFKRWWRRQMPGLARFRQSFLRWSIVLAVATVILAIGLVLFSPLMNVREIKVYRASPRLDIERVQQVLAPLFQRHLVFITSQEIEEILSDQVPDLAEVTVDKRYPSTLAVTIRLDPLVARLAILDPNEDDLFTATGAAIDFLTAEGVYIATTAVAEAETLPEINLVDWGVRPNPGEALVPAALLERLQATQQALEQQFGHNITIQTIYLRAREYHLLADGISLWFDMVSPLESHLQRYRTFLQSVERSQVTQYIDLRLKGRVVYR